MSTITPIRGQLTVTSDISLIGLLGDWAVTLARVVPGADGAVDLELNLRLVLTELFTNAIRHAYQDNEDGRVDLEFEGRPGVIELTVHDYGPGVKEGVDIENPSLPEDNEEAETGRGLFLVRQLVESLAYHRGENRTSFKVQLEIPEHTPEDEALLKALFAEGQRHLSQ